METTILPNKMDLGNEEARPSPDLAGLPQERNIWRIPEFPPITQEEIVGNDPSFGERRTICVHRTSEETERSQEQSRNGKKQRQFGKTLPERVQDSQIGAFSYGQCVQYGHHSYGFHSQATQKDEKDFSKKPIDEIRYNQYSMDVKRNKVETELKKFTSNINKLKNNDKTFTECCKVKNARLESVLNKCDRIQKKCKVKNDELEDIYISHINDQLLILKNHVLEIVDNTNLFATHLARSDSERQKQKNEIIAHVEKINKNYETNTQMKRHSTPFTEEKPCVNESLTP
ncbi:hypothetical protein O181_010060 [Austropuccinia psidii MF-1]|uniref:Uncharacterized protein n=1 Tax=Austropuccinia psidii MF-1 TaxID=1389203 RepID=A0A9Q3BSG3_9BASI|nr:hypothetical protein [Austropuccinia psidii MF-1]